MKALLLVAHGSKNQDSNDEIHALTHSLSALIDSMKSLRFEIIGCAFLELAQPNIESGIIRLVKSGATEITVLPYFLAAGNHVIEDVPEIISNVKVQHPELVIRTVPHIGKAANLPNLLAEHLNENDHTQ